MITTNIMVMCHTK